MSPYNQLSDKSEELASAANAVQKIRMLLLCHIHQVSLGSYYSRRDNLIGSKACYRRCSWNSSAENIANGTHSVTVT